MTSKTVLAGAVALAVVFAGGQALAATNLVANGDFEAAANAPTSAAFSGGGGTSAAPSWLLYNNAFATTSTEVVDATLPDGGDQMLHIVTGGSNNGVYQVFGGLARYAQVRLFVNSGSVRLFLYLDGNTEYGQVASTTTGAWETLTLNTGSANSNEIVIYANGGAADFYIDNAYAGAEPGPPPVTGGIPEPSTWALLIAGFGGAGGMLRRRRALAAA
jgi:hypothetical protein